MEPNVTKQQPSHPEVDEGAWPEGFTGPLLVVSLDDEQGEPRTVGPGEIYILDGRLWVWEEPGCAVCNEEGDSSATLHTVDESECRCLRHGALVEVPYLMKRRLEVAIGPIERSNTEEIRDSMLFPASLSEDELRRTIEQMLGADAAVDEETGVLP